MRRLRVIVAVLAALALLSACSGSGSGGGEKSAERTEKAAKKADGKNKGGKRAGSTAGGGGDAQAAGTSSGSGAASTTTVAPVPGGGHEADDEPTGGTGEGGEGQASRKPKAAQPPTGIVKSVSPRCVEETGLVTVVIETMPLADVVYAAAFSDGDAYGQYGLGTADDQGTFTWRVQVPPQAPSGPVELIVAASGPNQPAENAQNGKGGFRVAAVGGC